MQDPVSDHLIQIFTFVNNTVIATVISILGVIFNIINIIVFIKLGFAESVNITLLALTVVDLASLLPLIWMGLCYNPSFVSEFGNVDFSSLQYLTAGWPHVCLTRITGWLTVYVTLERYLCVAIPLKIKRIITPRRTFVIVLCMFIILLAASSTIYYGVILSPITNGTVIYLVYLRHGEILESWALYFNQFAQLSSFTFVTLLTIALVRKFQEKVNWRNSTSSASKNESISTRDRGTIKMIISISIIFIITYLPMTCIGLCMVLIPGFGVVGTYRNLFLSTGTFIFCLEAINSTVNIFVYLKMSSKYRETFLSVFRRFTPHTCKMIEYVH